ncbi:MFS transporter [Streptomyces sp. KL116D]|uniref:MFS transporter n=1 Tax=Streptomyces sp. KL116D TaxID=3045152 RepID=UPI00355684A8
MHLQSALDLTTAQLGLLISAAQLVPLAGLLVAGELLDRYSERWVVGVGASIVALALGAGAWLRDTRPAGRDSCWSVRDTAPSSQAEASRWPPGSTGHSAAWRWASGRQVCPWEQRSHRPYCPSSPKGFGWRATLLTGGFVALLGAALFAGLLPPPARRVRSTGQGPSDPLAAQLGARLRMLREPSTVKIMLSGTSLISVQYGVAVLAVLHLHQTSSVGAGQAALVLVASQGAGRCGPDMSGRLERPERLRALCHRAGLHGRCDRRTGRADDTGRAGTGRSFRSLRLARLLRIRLVRPVGRLRHRSAPPGKTGFALGLAMSVNQIAIVTVPPALGLLVDLTSSFTPAWALLSLLTVVALAVTVKAELHTR